jgi:hypothetical protein
VRLRWHQQERQIPGAVPKSIGGADGEPSVTLSDRIRLLAVVTPSDNNTLNGATFPFTPLRSIPADIIHFGSLLFGLWAAYATWRVLRGGRTAIDAGDTTGAEGADATRSPRVG